MVVKSIVDQECGKRWDIIKHEPDRYSVNYYEFYHVIGWRLVGTDRDLSKDCIELEFDCTVA